jgi:DNA segregation ATPase FtsK/SpoIIIE and related proteins
MDVLGLLIAKLTEYGLPSEPLTVNRYALRSRFEMKPRVTPVPEKLETIRHRVQQELGALHVNWFRLLPGDALGLEIPNAALKFLGDPGQLEWLASDRPEWSEDIEEPLVQMALRIEKQLAAHGCAGQVVSVQTGAGLVRFEICLKEDIKTVVKHAMEIVESLKARIVVPIPATDTLFLELSYVNLDRQTVPPISGESREAGQEAEGEHDPLYTDAVRVVTETRKASISGIQRRLKIGYNRAARMIESMEAAGLVGPLQSDGSREVLTAAPPKN